MYMMENLSQEYVTPIVEVLEVQVEKGFASSTGGQLPDWEVE